MKKIVIIVIAIIVVVVAGYLVFFSEPQNTQDNNNQLVGNDKDEHGCIGSAGYSWCEEKQKCLRVWEEPCSTGDTEAVEVITAILAAKYNKNTADVVVNVTKLSETHAVGNVFFKMNGEQGEGGMFLAIKEEGKWKVVYDGNGSVDCALLKNTYRFSSDLLIGFCD